MRLTDLGLSRAELDEIRSRTSGRGLRDPLAAFRQHQAGAARRGVAFNMTFAEWWGIWQAYYHLRGPGINGLCMARNGDEGAYEVGNVYLTTNLGNRQDSSGTAVAARRRQSTIERRAKSRWGKKFSPLPLHEMEEQERGIECGRAMLSR